MKMSQSVVVVKIRVNWPVTSEVWNWSPWGPLIPAKGCATSGTIAPRLAGPVPSRTQLPRATPPGGWGARPCSLLTIGRIVSTPPWWFRRVHSQGKKIRFVFSIRQNYATGLSFVIIRWGKRETDRKGGHFCRVHWASLCGRVTCPSQSHTTVPPPPPQCEKIDWETNKHTAWKPMGVKKLSCGRATGIFFSSYFKKFPFHIQVGRWHDCGSRPRSLNSWTTAFRSASRLGFVSSHFQWLALHCIGNANNKQPFDSVLGPLVDLRFCIHRRPMSRAPKTGTCRDSSEKINKR